MPGDPVRERLGVVTWILPGWGSINPQSAAASKWLTTDSGPEAMVAPNSTPSRVGLGSPTEKYAAVQAMKPAAGYATFDRGAPDAEADQLRV